MRNIYNSTGHELKYSNFIRAENCTLIDSEGKKYLDLESGVWCTSIGHSHPRITETISEQSSKMMHSGYCYLNPIIDIAADKIIDITGIGSGKCVFLCSGSESVEYAVKLSRSISDKRRLLTMKNCYLSAYGISGERSEDDWVHFDWANDSVIEKIDFSQIAAFVFEPGSSLGLVRFPPANLIQQIVSNIRRNGGIVIANEVTTGTGRTGKWFGYQHYGFIPDIVAIGKGLGNGYPVSCVAISEEIVNRINPDRFHYAQSHQNDPLGAAIAKQVIEILETEDLLDRANEIGSMISRKLEEIRSKYGIIKEVRHRGLMIAIEFEENEECSFAQMINSKLLEKHIILVKRPGYEVFRIDPALTIELKDVEYFLKSLETAIAEVRTKTSGSARRSKSAPSTEANSASTQSSIKLQRLSITAGTACEWRETLVAMPVCP
ncbi:Acetylornithine aminotransferase [Chitinispirillum alkaliphilum]|nr:Acetylornithine aminotransferase [Chitinispirillum alkaliphilum]